MVRFTHQMLTVSTAVLLAGMVLPAESQSTSPTRSAAQGQKMSMDDMRTQCREHCQSASKSVDATLATVREAKQSNDPAKMRAALDQIEKPLAQMKDHMNMCVHMMDMMPKHGGMMGGGMRGTSGMMHDQKHGAKAAEQKGSLDIGYKSEPDPPKTGENTFEVTVKGPDGKPVADADVSVKFYMAAMPSMNMPEMRNSIPLKHVSGGRYRGAGNVAMSGKWDVTVVVTKGGKEIGSHKLTVTAK